MAAEMSNASVSALPAMAPARSGRFALNLASNVGKLGLTMLGLAATTVCLVFGAATWFLLSAEARAGLNQIILRWRE
jgi:hypothetical protein